MPDIILGVVVSQKPLHDLAKLFEDITKLTGWEVATFPTTDDARAWIQKRVSERFGVETLTFE